MNIEQYNYNLPARLIAKHPAKKRSNSRLLSLNKNNGNIEHKQFTDIIDFLQPNDLLVVNNSKVIKARLYGNKDTGGKVEILIERIISLTEAFAHIKASRSPSPGDIICIVNTQIKIKVLGRDGSGKIFKIEIIDSINEKHLGSTSDDSSEFNSSRSLIYFKDLNFYTLLDKCGEIPLPPYMDREPTLDDVDRYQTVYAKYDGSVAAPTAGLHFDAELIQAIKTKGIAIAEVTLHVGAGTFQPVQVENIAEHKMHSELIEINTEAIKKITKAKNNKGRIIAVGTTAVRVLETVAQQNFSSKNLSKELQPFIGETDIFIYPGFEFKIVDALITNFHLPKSSLIMLVSALAGRENIMAGYMQAIDYNYNFYSYGDAMFIS